MDVVAMNEKYSLFFEKLIYFLSFGVVQGLSFTCLYTIRDLAIFVSAEGMLSLVILFGILIYRLILDLFEIRTILQPELHECAVILQDAVLAQYEVIRERFK